VVGVQLEGLIFSVLICVTKEVFHICTSIDIFNRNTLLSSN
jgi:hypothetical protein